MKFETSEWITLFSSDSQTGEYRFSVEAFDTQSPDPRFGEIRILPESDEIVWTDMTKISVQQMGQLPDAPKAFPDWRQPRLTSRISLSRQTAM